MAYFPGVEARLQKPCRDAIEGIGQELLVYAVVELFPHDSLKDFASTKSDPELKRIFKPCEIKDIRDGTTQIEDLDVTNIYKLIEHHCNIDRADFKISGTLAYYLWEIKDGRNAFMHGNLAQTLSTRDAVIAKIEDLKVLYKNMIMKLAEKQCTTHGRRMKTYEHYAAGITKRLDDLRPEMAMEDLAKQMEMLSNKLDIIHTSNQPKTAYGAASLPKDVPQRKQVFILNYVTFKDVFTARHGAEEDSINLRSTFCSIGYNASDVHIHENLSASQTDHVLDQIQQDTSLDFLLLMILSHGINTDTFYCSDSQAYSLRNIQARFTDDACPRLKDKAKVIICSYDRGNNFYTDSDVYSEDTVFNTRKVPMPRHMVTIHSSREGCFAIRNTVNGSYFVHTLCEVLKETPGISLFDAYNLLEEKMRRITYKMNVRNGWQEMQGAQLPEMKIASPIPWFNF